MKKNEIISSRLKNRIKIECPVDTADSMGGFVRTWQELASVWADIIPRSGKEIFYASALQPTITHRVFIRYRDDITADMRIVFGSREMAIKSVIDKSEDKILLEIMAEEGGAS